MSERPTLFTEGQILALEAAEKRKSARVMFWVKIEIAVIAAISAAA